MTPKERAERLASIPLNALARNHEWLRHCFAAELKQRLTNPDYEEFESIYHCALLLHIISDLDDLPLMYSAKCSGDMDLGCGFDWQFLYMRDPSTLKAYARSIERPDIEEWIAEYEKYYFDEDMKNWLEGTTNYHRTV